MQRMNDMTLKRYLVLNIVPKYMQGKKNNHNASKT